MGDEYFSHLYGNLNCHRGAVVFLVLRMGLVYIWCIPFLLFGNRDEYNRWLSPLVFPSGIQGKMAGETLCFIIWCRCL